MEGGRGETVGPVVSIAELCVGGKVAVGVVGERLYGCGRVWSKFTA